MESASSYRVALYGRVSIERDDRSASVDDQLSDLRKWAEREQWQVAGEYRDDGLSASRFAAGRVRPGWQDAMGAVTSGEADALLIWEVSRASRDRPVFAALFAACADAGVKIGTGGRLHDLTDADDGFVMDLGAALAVRESAVTSRRTRRAVESRAAAGRPHGSVPYGYRKVVDPSTGATVGREVHPVQGPVVAEITRRLLAGEPANAIAADLNARGITTSKGREWLGGNLSKLARRATYAGFRTHHGEVLAGVQATWPAIVAAAEHHQLVAMYGDPGRDKFRHVTHARHLGSGLYRCGRDGCDGRMRVAVQAGEPNRYDCRSCHRLSRHQHAVDGPVELLLARRLAQPDVLMKLAEHGEDAGVKAAGEEAAALRAKLVEARRLVDADQMSLESFAVFERSWRARIEDAERRARPRWVPDAVYGVAGVDAEKRWAEQSIVTRRVILAALAEVTILPAGSKRPAGPELIKVRWKGAGG